MPAAVISVKRRRRATRAFSFFAVGECCRAVVLNCDSFDLDDFCDCFIGTVSSLAEPGNGIVPGPGDEDVKEVFAVGEGVVGAAPLQVFVDCHEGGEPEAGGGYPADERMGPGRGWRSARAADDWRQCSPANRRSRRRASWGANFRWTARTRALRALRVYIWGSPHEVYLTMGEPKFLFFVPFRAILPRWWIPGMTGAGTVRFRREFWSLDAKDAGCQGCRMPRMPRRFGDAAGVCSPGPLRMKGGTPRRTGTMVGCGFKDWERASVRAFSCGEGRPQGPPLHIDFRGQGQGRAAGGVE